MPKIQKTKMTNLSEKVSKQTKDAEFTLKKSEKNASINRKR